MSASETGGDRDLRATFARQRSGEPMPMDLKTMSASDTPTKPADPIRRLLGQNFYQRLGLTTNGVSHSEICQGYQKRLLKLERMRGQLPEPDLLGAIQLVEEAFRELSQSRTRRRYDAELIAAGGKATVADSRQLLMGRYELKQLLTEGARTMLYKAFDTHLKREVVIKQHRGEQEQTDLQRQAMQQQVNRPQRARRRLLRRQQRGTRGQDTTKATWRGCWYPSRLS